MRAPAAASSSEIARPMPREPPVTTAVSHARPTISTAAPDRGERAGRMAAGRPVDPARHLREHLARARPRGRRGGRRRPCASKVSFQSVGKQNAVPSRRRTSSPPRDRRVPRGRSTARRGRGSIGRPAISGRDRVGDRPHQLAVDRPAHRQRQHREGAGRRAPRGRPSTASALPVRTNCVEALTLPIQTGARARAGPRSASSDGLAARADDRAHRAADCRAARSRARRRSRTSSASS